jgi:hypothetical protein
MGTENMVPNPFALNSAYYEGQFSEAISPRTGLPMVLFTDQTSGSISYVNEGDISSSIYHRIIIGRGMALAPTWNCMVNLNTGMDPAYAIQLAYGKPPTLLYFSSVLTSGSWEPVASLRNIGNCERYGGIFDMRIYPDVANNIMCVELGNGNWMRHSPILHTYALSGDTYYMPTQQLVSVGATGGWLSFEDYQLNFSPVNASGPFPSSPVFGNTLVNGYGLATTNPSVSGENYFLNVTGATGSVTAAGYIWQSTTYNYDNSLGYGSAVPPQLADFMVYVPPIWSYAVSGYPEWTLAYSSSLPALKVHETRVWDDANRISYTLGSISLDNSQCDYTGVFGNYALTLSLGNAIWHTPDIPASGLYSLPASGYLSLRLTGILGETDEGIMLYNEDPKRYVKLPFSDHFSKCNVPIGQELILDGLCFFTALRIVLQLGNINPIYLTNIPDYGFPPYGNNVPNILGRGTGVNPMWRYMPNDRVMDILGDLLRSQGQVDVTRNISIPYYLSICPSGGVLCQPYDAGVLTSYGCYGTTFASGYAGTLPLTGAPNIGSVTGVGISKIISPIKVYNSISQLRSEITLQGQDFNDYSLLQYSQRLDYNLPLIGYRRLWLERSPQYGSDAQMAATAKVMKWQASLGSQIISCDIPYEPNLYPGMKIDIYDPITLGPNPISVVIIRMDSDVGTSDESGVGNPETDCVSRLLCRSAALYTSPNP